MVLFGGPEGLHASHMAMFHPPHDVQVVLRVHAADARADDWLRSTLAKDPLHWSLAPQPFDLNRLAHGQADRLHELSADIYRGHFERDGTRQASQVRFGIEQVVLFQPLPPAAGGTSQREFVWVGCGTEHYVIRRIDRRPDVDLIARFETSGAVKASGRLPWPGPSVSEPSLEALDDALRALRVGARPARWVYIEKQDLQ